jgi:hypothetical protein
VISRKGFASDRRYHRSRPATPEAGLHRGAGRKAPLWNEVRYRHSFPISEKLASTNPRLGREMTHRERFPLISVFIRRLVKAINHKYLSRNLPSLQPQAKLRFDGFEDVGRERILAGRGIGRAIVRQVREREVVF